MFITCGNDLKKYALIALVILLSLRILQELHKYRIISENEGVEAIFVLWDQKRFCAYRSKNFSFTLPRCEGFKQGSVIRVIGRFEGGNDTNYFVPKSLKIESIESCSTIWFSAICWSERWLQLLLGVKSYLIELTSRLLSPKTAGLVQALLLGDRNRVLPKIKHYFEVTGTLHFMAVSGLHVGVLIKVVSQPLKKLPRFWRVSLTLLLLWSYVLMLAVTPSVVRVALMTTYGLLAREVFLRSVQRMVSLGWAVAVMLAVNPWWLFQIGFQLSVMASFIIILITRGKQSELFLGSTLKSFQISVFVTWFIAPVLWWHFGVVQWFSILASVVLGWFFASFLKMGWWGVLFLILISQLSFPEEILALIWLASSVLALFWQRIFLVLTNLPGLNRLEVFFQPTNLSFLIWWYSAVFIWWFGRGLIRLYQARKLRWW